MLGHDTSKCRKTKSSKQGSRSEVKIVDSTKANQECYFVECKVNDVLVQGFIDTGCSIVTIRETTATQLNLKLSISTQCVKGYAGGMTKPLGESTIKFEVDLMGADVTAHVVRDDVQTVPIIVGQTFLNQCNCTMVLRDNHVSSSR